MEIFDRTFSITSKTFWKHRCFDETFLNILQMNQLCIIFWLSIRNPDSLGWFMRVGKVSKNLKEFFKFVKTNFSFFQGAFFIFPRCISPFPFIHLADFSEKGKSALWIRIRHCLLITYEGVIHLKDVFVALSILSRFFADVR